MASISFNDIGSALTATDADPNVTPPAAGRTFQMPNRDNRGTFPSGALFAAFFNGGASPDVDLTIWVLDEASQTWIAVGTISTLIAQVAQNINTIPHRAEVYAQVTAVNGGPTDFSLHSNAI
jgi:hypothetical protein